MVLFELNSEQCSTLANMASWCWSFLFGILQFISIASAIWCDMTMALFNRIWCKHMVKEPAIAVSAHCKADVVPYDLVDEWMAMRTVRL